MNVFEKFLLRHRPYCERCSIMTLTPSTQVIRDKGHNVAVCDKCSETYKPIQAGLSRRAEIYRNQFDY